MNIIGDKKSYSRSTEKYNTRKYHIFNNSCYNHIFTNLLRNKKTKLYYLNNNIPKSSDYSNSSVEAYSEGEEDVSKEVLPYKSEIVVPLLPFINDNSYNLLGFLCVDCNLVNGFDDNYDLATVQTVSDAIYDVVKKWIDQNNNNAGL